jgi:transcriptional regulator with XRE-family HTH domain
MQAISVSLSFDPYNALMPMGRPAKSKRAPLGERITALRERAGLSQTQLAAKLGLGQQTVAYWERRASTLKSEQIKAIAEALQAAPEEILGMNPPKKRGPGPTGKARQVFERVSQLPRATQQRILANVEDSLTAYEARKAS